MSWPATAIDPLLAVAAATFDESGSLLEANAGFRRIVRMGARDGRVTSAALFFVQPDFQTLLTATPRTDGEIFHG